MPPQWDEVFDFVEKVVVRESRHTSCFSKSEAFQTITTATLIGSLGTSKRMFRFKIFACMMVIKSIGAQSVSYAGTGAGAGSAGSAGLDDATVTTTTKAAYLPSLISKFAAAIVNEFDLQEEDTVRR